LRTPAQSLNEKIYRLPFIAKLKWKNTNKHKSARGANEEGRRALEIRLSEGEVEKQEGTRQIRKRNQGETERHVGT